ncbi:MAG: hypothetical protein ACJAVG_001252, partial [Rickettsiales bacterium]
MPEIQKNLEYIFQYWSELGDDQKRKKINFILPFVQILSYLKSLQNLGLIPPNESFLQYQENFRKDYKNLFGQDLSKMESSDFSPKSFQIIAETQLGDLLSDTDRNELLKYDKKYVHSHSRIMFNYGNFLEQIFQNLEPEIQSTITSKATDLLDDKKDIVEVLFGLNDLFELEKNSGQLQKDDVENHALLAQISNYLENIFLIKSLLDDDKTKEIKDLLTSINQPLKSSVKRNKVDQQKTPQNFEEDLKRAGLSIQVGIETEFSLLGLDKESKKLTPIQRNVSLKKSLSDLNSRRSMEIKFGSTPKIPEVYDLTKFYEDTSVTSIGAEGMVIDRKNFIAIANDLKQSLVPSVSKYEIERIKRIEISVANLTEAEAFFYNLLFLNEDFAKDNKIEVDGLYDPTKSREENLKNVWGLIEIGRFHEKLLDMIQAHEISLGPHDFSQIIDVKDKALERMRFLANYSNLSLDDPNVQVNLSLWVLDIEGFKQNALLPKITKEGDQVTVYFNQLGLEFLKILEQVVVEAESEVGGILRSQKEVESAFDRRKYIFDELKGTPYLDTGPGPSYLTHRIGGAKNVNIRVSMINDKIAVAEIRLIGNNPHFAKFEGSEDVYKSSLEFIPEALIPRIANKMQEFVRDKSPEELVTMYQQKVKIRTDGRFNGLEAIATKQKQPDNIFDPKQKSPYNPKIPSNAVALKSYRGKSEEPLV